MEPFPPPFYCILAHFVNKPFHSMYLVILFYFAAVRARSNLLIIYISHVWCLFVFQCSNEWGGVCLFHHPLSHLGSRGRESHAPRPHQPRLKSPHSTTPLSLFLRLTPQLHPINYPGLWGMRDLNEVREVSSSMLCTSSLHPATFVPHKNLPNWKLLFAKWRRRRKSLPWTERREESRNGDCHKWLVTSD